MQTAEKTTPSFFIKLILLFVLLITGVVFKTTNLTQTVDANNLKPSSPSTAMDPDSQQIRQLYFRMVSNDNVAI